MMSRLVEMIQNLNLQLQELLIVHKRRQLQGNSLFWRRDQGALTWPQNYTTMPHPVGSGGITVLELLSCCQRYALSRVCSSGFQVSNKLWKIRGFAVSGDSTYIMHYELWYITGGGSGSGWGREGSDSVTHAEMINAQQQQQQQHWRD